MHIEDLKKSLLLDLGDLGECTTSTLVAANQAHVLGCQALAANVGCGEDVIELVRCWLRARPADGVLQIQSRDLITTSVQLLLQDELSRLRGNLT